MPAKQKAKERKPEDRHIATFEAYIPTIKSAILFGNDGAQVKIEIPLTDQEAAIALTRQAQGKVLHVSVFEAPDQHQEDQPM